MTFGLHKHSGFTLIEMMVVIAIILILLGIGLFPYRYSMDAAYIEKAHDGMAQEWILAHTSIRNGLLYDPLNTQHASLVFAFKKGEKNIPLYLSSGSTLEIPTQNYKTYGMENGVQILGFSSITLENNDTLYYKISPPYGSGVFYTGALVPITLSGVQIEFGYLHDTRGSKVLLRPYLR